MLANNQHTSKSESDKNSFTLTLYLNNNSKWVKPHLLLTILDHLKLLPQNLSLKVSFIQI